MDFTAFMSILIAGILTENLVLVQTLGVCPFLGVSKKLESSLGMGVAVIFVLILSGVACYALYYFVLVPLNIAYLQTITFILIIAVLVQSLDIVLKKLSPSLYNQLGVYLALITTNCIVLFTANNAVSQGFTLLGVIVNSFAVGVGFTLALVLMSGIRESFNSVGMPKSIQGLPAALITAGIMAMAFTGFSGLFG